jgi:hypothetical protein
MKIEKPIKAKVEAFKKAHPVGQSFSSGKWGFERACDCLNLNRCIYDSKRAAEMARAEAANCAASCE